MTTVTMIQLDKTELQTMLDAAAEKAVQRAAEQTGEHWGPGDLARHYGCSVRTIHNRQRAGLLPPRDGPRWRKADVLRWDRERAAAN